MKKVAIAIFITTLMAITASAGTCQPGSVGSLLATTCDIGNLRFSFAPGGNEPFGDTSYVQPSLDEPNLSFDDLHFAPLADGRGFTISQLPGVDLGDADGFSLLFKLTALRGGIVGLRATIDNPDTTLDSGGGILASFNGNSLFASALALDGAYSEAPAIGDLPFDISIDASANGWNLGPASEESFTYTVATVPEPGSLMMLGAGLLLLVRRSTKWA